VIVDVCIRAVKRLIFKAH